MFSVDEKKLSPEAQKLLSNQKNKAEFVRKAIEFFVRNQLSDNSNIENYLKEINEKLDILLRNSNNLNISKDYFDQASDNTQNIQQHKSGIQERLSRLIK